MEGAAVMDNNLQQNGSRGAFAAPEELSVNTVTGGDKVRGTIKRFFLWLYLTGKRFLKKPSFVLILLMLPAVLLLYRALITADDGKLHVAVYFEEKDAFAEAYLSELSEHVPELFIFYECEEEEDLYSDVAAGRAECGYVFSANLAEKFLTEDWRGLITAVESERTVYGGFVNEIAYVKLIRILGMDLVQDYLLTKSGKSYSHEEAKEFLRKSYEEEMARSLLIEYVTTAEHDGEFIIESKKRDVMSVLKKPIRGTVAIFILLTGLAGLVFWYQDDAEGRYRVMARERRPLASFASILLPIAMSGVIGIVCLGISGLWMSTGTELVSMILYVLFTAAFCNILRFLIPSVHAVCAVIPILTLISYLCCPIMIDIAPTVPVIRYLRALLVPQYYLRIFEGKSVGLLAAATAVLLAISALLSVPERNR